MHVQASRLKIAAPFTCGFGLPVTSMMLVTVNSTRESGMKKIISFITSAALLTGCTEQQKTPSNYVSPLEFKSYNCKQIAKEMARTSQMLDKHDEDNAASNVAGAAIAVFAISRGHGVSFGDDEEATRLKSKYEALHQASIEKNCD